MHSECLTTADSAALAAPESAKAPTPAAGGMWLYATAVFTSAFLLFQVQLMISKYILPWFGGTAAVWTTAMLFFQVLLLAGYGYAHLLSTQLSSRSQFRVHAAVVAAAILLLSLGALHWPAPIMPGSVWKPLDPNYPVWRILRLLTVSVGLPFLVLSATSPLLQAWFSRTYSKASPYRLYALSNLGSLLGLLAYPFIIEPRVTLRGQGWLWAMLFAFFAACCCSCGWLARTAALQAEPGQQPGSTRAVGDDPPTTTVKLLWVALAATASCMLLATTNKICQDVAVIPFLWVLPLVLYLLSFIVCFDKPQWYRRGIFHPLYGVSMLLAATVLLKGASATVLLQICFYCIALFAICMVCHGELVRLRPGTGHLTSFYLLLATGGAIGGMFVALVAPHIFAGWWELQIGIAASMLLLACVLVLDRSSWLRRNPYWLAPLILVALAALPFQPEWRTVLLDTSLGRSYCLVLALMAIPAVAGLVRQESVSFGPVSALQLSSVLASLLLGATLVASFRQENTDRMGGGRNFFGVLVLMDSLNHGALGLRHGATLHGFQIKAAPTVPTTYYGPDSGIGRLLQTYPRRDVAGRGGLRVGVIGLGVGTLAAYSLPGDYYRFYEINPLVAQFSAPPHPQFTFLQSARGHTEIVMGDARLSLEREAQNGQLQNFDVLVLDAFNSDAIPVHLLTKEAMNLYLKHLRGPQSVIAVHITNKTLDLQPVVLGLCAYYGLQHVDVTTAQQYPSNWVLLSPDPQALNLPAVQAGATALQSRPVLWTDDFSNLFEVLRY